MTTQEDGAWHLDKRIPIAIILGLLGQAAGFGWFAATLNERVAANASQNSANAAEIQRLDLRLEAIREGSVGQAVQLGRIEEQIKGLRADVSRAINAGIGASK